MSAQVEFAWPLIGHEKIKKFLQAGVVERRLAQTYLFYGPEKVGKTTLAKYLAKTVFCASFAEYNKLSNILTDSASLSKLPCGTCESCQQFDRGIYPEFYLVEREINEKTEELRQNITINQVRELQNKLNKRSFSDSYKVAIIRGAETLTKEASNALLKTLEEPTPKTILILLTTAREIILETIQSRSQNLQFLPVTRKEIEAYLISKGLARSQADEIASLAQGRPTIALKYLENQDIVKEQLVESEKWLELLAQNNQGKLKAAEKIVQGKPSIDSLIKGLTSFSIVLRDLLLVQAGQLDLITFRELIPVMQQSVKEKMDLDLTKLLQRIEQAKVQLKQNVNARLILENLFLNI
ncbi:MAG: polymerase III, delta prime subunit protein [Parcubacteria group bacterium GW2011_GWC2_39_14]|nr:MAG: polymerase III, delta prime subunit protein [Parcubacteria group bacterium GW2011_GWC2_39_14]KKR54590.1 MAG: polymerase III, delta prime subunit protein [Parcubacteria group bacterium GW2011_GWA2_40_23]